MEHDTARIEERTGQSRHLRQILKAAREAQGLTQQQVADRVSDSLELERRLTPAAISEWERFTRHPPISVMLHPDTADLARMIDLLGEEDRRLIQQMVSRMKPRRDRV